MAQKLLLLFICFLFPVCVFAQLTREHNAIRPGDEIVKQQVVYKNPGKAGTDQFWNFSELLPANPEYPVSYTLPGMIDDSLYVMGRDTLTLEQTPVVSTKHYTMYYYLQRNDSLLQLGHENPNTQLQYTKPMLAMKYPFNYGNVLVSDYESRGLYSGTIDIHTRGTMRVEADAFGKMLIPDGDTLMVMRVKATQLITELRSPSDSIQTPTNRVMETYCWYSKGYRYPVFESIRSIQLGDSITQFNTSFYFPPQEHYYLDTDPENVAILDSLWNLKENTSLKMVKPDELNRIENLRVNIWPNPVKENLNIEFTFEEDTSAFTMTLYTMSGEPIKEINYREIDCTNKYSEVIDCSSIPPGNYLLKLITNIQIETFKIIKY